MRALIFRLAPCMIALAGPAGAETWGEYRDSLYDCRIEYPSSVFAKDPFDLSADVQRFSGPDAQTYFRVKGVNNKDNLDPAAIKAKYLSANVPGDIVYERTRSDFLVLSGVRADSIFYSKAAVSANNRTICILEITYPKKAKQAFDQIVTRMSRTFSAAN